MNTSTAANVVQWLFLDLNAFFASCEQQETPALRGKPIIVVQTLTDSACAIAASYPAKRLGITTGTLVREARRICADVIAVQARHRLYTDYHERISEGGRYLPAGREGAVDRRDGLPPDGNRAAGAGGAGDRGQGQTGPA